MVTFSRCFDRKKIDYFRRFIPKTYRVMEDMAGHRPDWPTRIECMTAAETRQGPGHGLYDPDEQRIAINASMSPLAIYLNFIHENLHHALPYASEAEVDRLTPIVYHRVTGGVVEADESEPVIDNPVAPVVLEARYNVYESWETPVDAPGVVTVYSMLGPSVLTAQKGPRRPPPKSVREALDRAAGREPSSIRRHGHVEVLRYDFRSVAAASKARKRIEKIRQMGYSVSHSMPMVKRAAVVRR